MRYRPLGRTGLQVSVLGQGGAAIGQQYGPVAYEEARQCVRTAIEAGVNFIDTSAYYGRGLSEEYLGRILAEDGLRQRVILCTKAGRLDRDVFDFSPAGLRRCFEQSLRRLRTDYVDILLAHDIEFADNYEAIMTETYTTLQELKQEGKARFIGMSAYPLGLLRRVVERCQLDVIISYAHYTLQNTRLLTELLPVAEARGTALINASPLALGLLTNQGPPPWHPAPESIKAACRAAADYCRQRGTDIAVLGMQFCYAQPRIPCTLTGTARTSELLINLQALETPPDPQMVAEVQAILAPVRDQSWPSGNWKD
ncbi:MAG: aldo/keto reductase [Gemmataceae bacterium]|nr:aldo/keto reductase [Gemmataceae bacterium]MCS7269809.1 aldo/keto reductase [Gemmataceae bacterium]MDW8243131.1 aldo/keto reductase [Thermogemmata sp.]